jgi:hypothetical protein
VAFGKTIAQQTVTQERIAEARCMIDQARLLTLKAAWMMDRAGNKAAKAEIAMIKVVAPNMAGKVIDWAMQVHGGAGMSQDFPLAYFFTLVRTLRFADGPDEVHRNAIAKLELGKYGTPGPRTGPDRAVFGCRLVASRPRVRVGHGAAAPRAARPRRHAACGLEGLWRRASSHSVRKVTCGRARSSARSAVAGSIFRPIRPDAQRAAQPVLQPRGVVGRGGKTIAQVAQLGTLELGVHHHPAHLGRCLGVDARLHAFDELLEHRLLDGFLQHACSAR